METDECIQTRRTCRSYLDKEIPMEKIAEILETARFAPSSANIQNWNFIVVREKKKRQEIAKICEQEWMVNAPVHIIVCNKKEDVTNYFPNRGELYSTQNCAMISSYILLKAHDLGLASCFVGEFDEEKLKELLNIPKEVTAEGVITLGYSKREEKSEADRIDIKHLTFFDEHGKKEIKKEEFWPAIKQIKKLTEKFKSREEPRKPSSLIKRAKDFVKRFKRENK